MATGGFMDHGKDLTNNDMESLFRRIEFYEGPRVADYVRTHLPGTGVSERRIARLIAEARDLEDRRTSALGVLESLNRFSS